MSAHNPPANRRTDRDSEPYLDQSGEHGQVSTRILLDSGTPSTCDACSDTIELKSRHKCLTVRDDTGAVREFAFCDEACLARKREELD